MFDADAYRRQLQSLDRLELQQQIALLIRSRTNLNDAPLTGLEDIDKIDQELAVIAQKLSIARALL